MKSPEECPECGYDDFHRIWQRRRRLAWRCEDCHWMSEPFTPPQQEIKTERVIQVGRIEYTLYDEYGHTMMMSRTYYNRDEAIEALQSDLIRNPGSTAILWPVSQLTVKGEVFK